MEIDVEHIDKWELSQKLARNKRELECKFSGRMRGKATNWKITSAYVVNIETYWERVREKYEWKTESNLKPKIFYCFLPL